jgi:hypothetical protein
MVTFDWVLSDWFFLILPVICIFGLLTNLTNIAVLSNHKMKDVSYKYILFISLSELFYLGLNSYIFIELNPNCPLYTSYFTQWYSIYIDNYLTSCLAIFCIFIDINLSLIRYSALKNKEYLQSLSYYLVIGILFLISLIYYLPVLFFNEIIPIIDHENKTSIDEFMVITNSLGLSLYGITTPIILSTIRIVLAMFVLTGINIMNIIEFKKRYSYRFNNKVFDISESISILCIYIIIYFLLS